MSDSTRLDFAVQLRHQMTRHEHDVLASHYGVRLTSLGGEPLSPIAIEADDAPDEFHVQHLYGGIVARVTLAQFDGREGWQMSVTPARLLGHIQLVTLHGVAYFQPFDPHGQRLTAHEALVDALRTLLDRCS